MLRLSAAAADMAAADMRVRKAIAEEAGTRARTDIAREAGTRSSVRAATHNSAHMATAAARIISATMPAARMFTVTSIAMLAGMNGRPTVRSGMSGMSGMFAVTNAMPNASAPTIGVKPATSATRIKKRSIATGMRTTATPIAENARISRTTSAAVRGRIIAVTAIVFTGWRALPFQS